jgi:hypothetical protein
LLRKQRAGLAPRPEEVLYASFEKKIRAAGIVGPESRKRLRRLARPKRQASTSEAISAGPCQRAGLITKRDSGMSFRPQLTEIRTVPATINLDDIDPAQRKQLGIRKPREVTSISKDEQRGWALKVLALMANLSRTERERVLRHALKVNKV